MVFCWGKCGTWGGEFVRVGEKADILWREVVFCGRKHGIWGREVVFCGEKMRDLRAKSGIFRVEIHDVGVTNRHFGVEMCDFRAKTGIFGMKMRDISATYCLSGHE